MPYPSNLPSRSSGSISPATIYLHDWHGETPPGGINFIQTQPVQPGDPVAILEFVNGSWRLLATPDNFVDLSSSIGGTSGRLVGRIGSIERRCNDIWIGTYTRQLWHSSDKGNNFSVNILEPDDPLGSGNVVIFTAYDASGRLWRYDDLGGSVSGGETVALFKSDSGKGDDWEAIFSPGDTYFTSAGGSFPSGRVLACHQTNPNIIAFAAVNFADGEFESDIPYCFITTNGGESFNRIQLPFQEYIEFPPDAFGIYDITFTESGRLIVMFENFENEDPFENRFFADYTDDYETFILNELLPEVRTGHFGFQGHLTSVGNLVFAAFTRDHDEFFSPTGFEGLICHVAKSVDNGSSYEEFVRFTQPTNEIVDMPGYPQGLFYDPVSKLLYVFFSSFSFDADGLTHDTGLFLQTVDESGNKAIATELIEASGLTIPYPLLITVTPQKGIEGGSSGNLVNRPKGFLDGNAVNLPVTGSGLCG